MLQEAPAMMVRNNLGELLNEVKYRHDSILITKAGKAVAALVDIDQFNRMRSLDKEFKRLTDELQSTYAEGEEATAEAEIAKAIAAARSA